MHCIHIQRYVPLPSPGHLLILSTIFLHHELYQLHTLHIYFSAQCTSMASISSRFSRYSLFTLNNSHKQLIPIIGFLNMLWLPHILLLCVPHSHPLLHSTAHYTWCNQSCWISKFLMQDRSIGQLICTVFLYNNN